jgi:hypothetical protein
MQTEKNNPLLTNYITWHTAVAVEVRFPVRKLDVLQFILCRLVLGPTEPLVGPVGSFCGDKMPCVTAVKNKSIFCSVYN